MKRPRFRLTHLFVLTAIVAVASVTPIIVRWRERQTLLEKEERQRRRQQELIIFEKTHQVLSADQ